MTHGEFRKQWHNKHKTVFQQVNRLLEKHGFQGELKTLSMSVPRSVLDTMPANAMAGTCCDNCNETPGSPTDIQISCPCPDGSGGFIVKQCWIPR